MDKYELIKSKGWLKMNQSSLGATHLIIFIFKQSSPLVENAIIIKKKKKKKKHFPLLLTCCQKYKDCLNKQIKKIKKNKNTTLY